MKGKFLVAALAFGLSAIAAKAQVGIYFNPVVSRISNSTADTGTFAFLGSGEKSNIFGGVVIGGYYDFYHPAKVDVGVDIRDSIEHGNSANLNSFLVGPRVSHQINRWTPYGEVLVGVGRSKAPLSPAHISKLEYNVLAGADFKLNKHIDVRAVEIGYGSVSTISTATYNSSIHIPAAKLLNFSAGFVFHF